MSRPSGRGPASTSAEKVRSSCARRSSKSDGACPSTSRVFAAYRRELLDARKPASVAAIAFGHRVQRLAFAMLRSQQPYDPQKWLASVAVGMTVMAKTQLAHQNDVTCPPPDTG
jgi:hypothetical protein